MCCWSFQQFSANGPRLSTCGMAKMFRHRQNTFGFSWLGSTKQRQKCWLLLEATCVSWRIQSEQITPRKLTCPLKRGPFQKELGFPSSKRYLSGDMFSGESSLIPYPFSGWQVAKCRVTTQPLKTILWVFPKIMVPQNGWFIREKPYSNGWFGGIPYFWKHPYGE